MDAVFPAGSSALARGRRRLRRAAPRLRHRTAPVTFAEIREVDEEEEAEPGGSAASLAGAGGAGGAGERRRRPDVLGERLDREFAAFRRRRLRRQPLREPDELAADQSVDQSTDGSGDRSDGRSARPPEPPDRQGGGRAASEPHSDNSV